MASNSSVLGKIAGTEIDELFPGINSGMRGVYVTSLVRQWRTNGGQAGLFTVAVNYWLQLVERGAELLVVRTVNPSPVCMRLARCGAPEGEFAEIVHRLSLAQSASFSDAGGRSFRIWADPKRRIFGIGGAEEEGDGAG